jgi:hypothetical protein
MIFVLVLLVDMLSFKFLPQWRMQVLHMKEGRSEVHQVVVSFTTNNVCAGG